MGRQPTGVDRVCLEYLGHFGARAQAVVQSKRVRGILDGRATDALFALLQHPPANFRAGLVRKALRHVRRLGQDGKSRLYLNIGHTGLNSEGFRKWVAASGVRPVYFVHDLIPITHPQYCRPGEADRHRDRMRTVLDTAAGVIANSQATIDDLETFARSESLPRPPAVAAWLGSALAGRPAITAEPDRPTFVVVGTIEGRKNHLLLLDIWARLADRLGADAPRLLIIGQRGWEAAEAFERLDGDRRLRGYVVELGRCGDDELKAHLASARALLFPSHTEGFGLPLVEAMGLGVPVIASDLPAFREVGQGIPLFLDPGDSGAWESAILDFASPRSASRSAQVQRLRDYRPPDWSGHFRTVETWLESLG